ncbi:hypothetical protein PISMIDRAFT_680760 [Pisolithus microcarpus 441]|uniref:Uncharacterized protein n=1 Tax=Pisolithus microcarpus 441 TaxID=765257 RepID=A0A0C9ZHQ5_9AGAM|nr:hypothetical protein PISMIDRAFT_680760 [Pisolithus microcarpus 441]
MRMFHIWALKTYSIQKGMQHDAAQLHVTRGQPVNYSSSWLAQRTSKPYSTIKF